MWWQPHKEERHNNWLRHNNPTLYKTAVAMKIGFALGICGMLIYCGHRIEQVGLKMMENTRVKEAKKPAP